MKVLILKAFSTGRLWGDWTISSFSDFVRKGQPQAQIDVCALAEGDSVGDPSQYQLIIITGGRVNLLSDPHPVWVTTILDIVRRVYQSNDQIKLLGVCWGHQAINFALGGELAETPGGPKIGVEELKLTPKGQEFFRTNFLNIHKFHKRYVTTAAPGFIELAEDNEILMSQSKQALTFQGHPELSSEISREILAGDDGSYSSTSEVVASLKDIESSHDGELIWGFIMQWAMTA